MPAANIASLRTPVSNGEHCKITNLHNKNNRLYRKCFKIVILLRKGIK